MGDAASDGPAPLVRSIGGLATVARCACTVFCTMRDPGKHRMRSSERATRSCSSGIGLNPKVCIHIPSTSLAAGSASLPICICARKLSTTRMRTLQCPCRRAAMDVATRGSSASVRPKHRIVAADTMRPWWFSTKVYMLLKSWSRKMRLFTISGSKSWFVVRSRMGSKDSASSCSTSASSALRSSSACSSPRSSCHVCPSLPGTAATPLASWFCMVSWILLHSGEQNHSPSGRASITQRLCFCRQPTWNSRSHWSHKMMVRGPNPVFVKSLQEQSTHPPAITSKSDRRRLQRATTPSRPPNCS
mmetsp:Transcript_14590/g.50154  ORF Transcript_14590/g.50154 Transcript_14590/m.50154 type:complete len:303 (-) Transcript_14590:701-1609(-)